MTMHAPQHAPRRAKAKRFDRRPVLWLASLGLIGGALALWTGQSVAQTAVKGQAPGAAAPSQHANHADHSDHAKHGPQAGPHASGLKANGSGVNVRATTPRAPVGSATRVTVTLDGIESEGATATVRIPSGMTITHADGRVLAGAIPLARGKRNTIELLVTPQADGTQYFDVTTWQGGRTSIKSIAVRAGTGQIKLKPQGQPVTMPNGEKVISLPAR